MALINQSNSIVATEFAQQIKNYKVFKIDKRITSLKLGEDKMGKSQIDATIILPSSFGQSSNFNHQVSGQALVLYTQNSTLAGQTITSLLESKFKQLSNSYTKISEPFTVSPQQITEKSLTAFDYTFAGLLGFSIIGIGIFGPMNVFPELKKQGILRRLHTTPLKVWQYFMATMLSQAIIGAVSIAIQFVVAISVFKLKVEGNYAEIFLFTIFSIFLILGIGLAIGGWAKNERQAAPLGNIIVFPMLFLSGTFFPRFEMPQWLQTISTYLPLTPVIDGLRYLTTEGKNLTQIGPQLGLMAIWMIIIYSIAFKVFAWE